MKSMSGGSSPSTKDWASASLGEAVSGEGDVFQRSGREIEEEEELKWAALERLPTYDRLRKGILKQVLDNGRVNYEEVDTTKLGVQEKRHLLESMLKAAGEDNEEFLHRMRDRIDRWLFKYFGSLCLMLQATVSIYIYMTCFGLV